MAEQTQKKETSLISDADCLRAISIFAGHVAHEFNNFLIPLTAYPQIIREALPPDSQEKDLVGVIEKTAKDMTAVTRQLMALSARDSQVGRVLDISQLVENVVMQVKTSPESRNVTIDFVPSSDLVQVTGSGDGVRDAVECLCWNAVEAAGDGGRVTVKTDSVGMDNCSTASGLMLGAGRYVVITVNDTGAGVPEQLRTKIFEPFFTTKKGATRRRAGLGLAIVYRVARDHYGAIDVESGPGKETSFKLYLSAGDHSAVEHGQQRVAVQAAAPAPASGGPLIPRDRMRLLIVDDEKTIQRLFNMILSPALPGVKIDMASNGAEALDRFSSGHHGVVLMDLHMPVMDGYAAFTRIERLCLDKNWEMPPVVFCTGYAPPDTVLTVVRQDSRHCLLSKPVSGEALITAVKTRLTA
jgi:nitrogen-specific signal transduction histidine kinase/ActR/RegA family two-component response regulator